MTDELTTDERIRAVIAAYGRDDPDTAIQLQVDVPTVFGETKEPTFVAKFEYVQFVARQIRSRITQVTLDVFMFHILKQSEGAVGVLPNLRELTFDNAVATILTWQLAWDYVCAEILVEPEDLAKTVEKLVNPLHVGLAEALAPNAVANEDSAKRIAEHYLDGDFLLDSIEALH